MPERPPPECANCGAAIPRHAKACPECGADERTGWRENEATRYDGLDLPESAFEDDEAPKRALKSSPKVNGLPWYWWLVGVLLILMLITGALALR